MNDDDLLAAIAEETALSERDAQAVIDSFCRQLHKRLYEYEGFNGDYLGEELLYQIGDFAWIHLFQFMYLHRLRSSSGDGDDDWMMSRETLLRLGGGNRWRRFFYETQHWQQSSRFGPDRRIYK